MATYSQYLDVLYKFYDKGWYLTDKAIKDYYNDTDKTPIDYDSNDLFEVLTTYYAPGSVSMIAHRIDAFKDLYENLHAEGYRLDNPTSDVRINATYIAKNANYMRPCYSDQEVEEIINCIPDQDTKVWFEALAMTFYSGVSNGLTDFVAIRYSDFDQVNRTVRDRKISNRLANLYHDVAEIPAIKGANGRTAFLHNHKNTLIPVGPSDKPPSVRAYLSKKFQMLSTLSGREVTADLLYNSGFIYYLVDTVGKDTLFAMMDATRFSPRAMEKIAEATTRYGYVETPRNLKRRIRVYVNYLRK